MRGCCSVIRKIYWGKKYRVFDFSKCYTFHQRVPLNLEQLYSVTRHAYSRVKFREHSDLLKLACKKIYWVKKCRVCDYIKVLHISIKV